MKVIVSPKLADHLQRIANDVCRKLGTQPFQVLSTTERKFFSVKYSQENHTYEIDIDDHIVITYAAIYSDIAETAAQIADPIKSLVAKLEHSCDTITTLLEEPK